ncbi:phosphatase PAP2 family protein [Hymenobacter sp. ASUV-10]|uniref:Phosphatase PAP2 family protein n=1 Tax=Hymenobacter aranciens TaxID=3063996 RepID=A0ABT9BB27_9BACT|nr:phosphatase PAP2 family protein [Hymenobacter sp. ASUV-10]MDO7873748.1 phosphatase PAP2 family protein [Hymenobacter sp. ASUV-10]
MNIRAHVRQLVLAASLAGAVTAPAVAQTPVATPATTPVDSLHKYENTAPVATPRKPFYKSKLFRASIVPAVLIGYGISTINDHGFYSSYDARSDIQQQFPGFHTKVDDYLQFVPYLELGATVLAGVESRNDRLNLLLVIAKSEALMLTTVYTIKQTSKILRPDGSSRNAFPSGHTAQAFLAASIVHTELRDKSQWYGIGAYTVATSVGVLRMLNNRHWQSDVFAGAGIGILSAHLAYLSHRNRWGRKPLGRGIGDIGMMPAWSPAGGTGLTLTWRPK